MAKIMDLPKGGVSTPNSSLGFPTANESGRYQKCCSNQIGDPSDQLVKCMFFGCGGNVETATFNAETDPKFSPTGVRLVINSDNSSQCELFPEVCCPTRFTLLSLMRVCEECGA